MGAGDARDAQHGRARLTWHAVLFTSMTSPNSSWLWMTCCMRNAKGGSGALFALLQVQWLCGQNGGVCAQLAAHHLSMAVSCDPVGL